MDLRKEITYKSLYCMVDPKKRFFKIGVSKNVTQRKAELSNQNGSKLCPLFWINWKEKPHTPNADGKLRHRITELEQDFVYRLRGHRHHGLEYFHYDKSLINKVFEEFQEIVMQDSTRFWSVEMEVTNETLSHI